MSRLNVSWSPIFDAFYTSADDCSLPFDDKKKLPEIISPGQLLLVAWPISGRQPLLLRMSEIWTGIARSILDQTGLPFWKPET